VVVSWDEGTVPGSRSVGGGSVPRSGGTGRRRIGGRSPLRQCAPSLIRSSGDTAPATKRSQFARSRPRPEPADGLRTKRSHLTEPQARQAPEFGNEFGAGRLARRPFRP
jgi:hypothetical protein